MVFQIRLVDLGDLKETFTRPLFVDFKPKVLHCPAGKMSKLLLTGHFISSVKWFLKVKWQFTGLQEKKTVHENSQKDAAIRGFTVLDHGLAWASLPQVPVREWYSALQSVVQTL